MGLAVVSLKKGEGRLLKSGGMWIFDNEIATIMGSFVNGDIVLIHDFDGYPLGKGFINTNSRITVRLLSPKKISSFFSMRKHRAKTAATAQTRISSFIKSSLHVSYLRKLYSNQIWKHF